MDTHDVSLISSSSKLAPGMVITVEPGLYIPDIQSVPPQFRGIGIRIEDDVLITDDEPVVLTREVPKDVAEIEALRRQ
jgi:Xaa-Pro aminopeptidase